ncbi:MAG: DUF438 domain-containing protein [Desulfovibrio sp.]|nr:DUF438 domain-containing protein [Desulfovibrio sp.]
MLLTKDTSIYTLTTEYPFLIDSLATHNKSFEKLKNPLLRQTEGRVASVEKAAGMGNESVLSLLLFIAGEIMVNTGESVEIAPPAGKGAQVGVTKMPEQERLAALKEIIKDLHAGVEFSKLQDKFNKTVGDITPQEIAKLEQTLVNEGLPETEIKKMCHLHAALFQSALEEQQMPQVAPGHPVHTYLKENAQAKKLVAEIREVLGADKEPAESEWPFMLGRLNFLTQELAGIQTHYVRKENQLFPLLEKHDLSAPGKVMWEVHDDIRKKFRRTQEILADKNRLDGSAALHDLTDEVDEMIRKEENILLPMCLQLLTEEDWGRCRLGDDEIGYSFGITPEGTWTAATANPTETSARPGLVDLSTGQLPQEVVDAILCNLPVDVSFVGPDDRVAYYSDSAHRIFPRSAAVIGREVKNCHPSKSVHMVTEILEAFKRGDRDKAEFWLELGGKFIHIQYLALKNKQGTYLGCLEVGQDATHLRSLTGQRRLLEWE